MKVVNAAGYFGNYKIKDPEELQERIDAYFLECDTRTSNKLVGAVVRLVPDPEPYTWTGLASAVGLTGRQSLINYMEKDEFAPILRKARERVDKQWEGCLQRLGNNNGVVFALTNNTVGEAQYVNKTSVDLGGQTGNPILVETNTTGLTEDQLEKIREVLLNANPVLG